MVSPTRRVDQPAMERHILIEPPTSSRRAVVCGAGVVAGRVGDWFAVVDLRELVGVLFEEVAEVPYEPRPVGWRDARPRAGFKRLPRRLNRKVDVCFVSRRNAGDDLLRRRVLDFESLAALGLDPFAVDRKYF